MPHGTDTIAYRLTTIGLIIGVSLMLAGYIGGHML